MTFRLDSLSNFNQFPWVAYGISESGCCVTIEFSLAKNGDLICTTDVFVVCLDVAVFECCVRDSSGILFCPEQAKKIQRIARPEGKRPKNVIRPQPAVIVSKLEIFQL